MPSKAEIYKENRKVKLKLRKGDRVMVIAGKDKGQKGFIAASFPKTHKVIVLQENAEDQDNPIPLNAMIKHYKAKFQGEQSARIKMPAPIHISNVMLLDPKTDAPTRVGRKKEDGKLVRYAKKSGTTIVETPNMEK
jgi:large subunit ribosomal protein L24